MTTRRDIIKAGAGLAAILASGKAPAYLVKSMLAARNSIGMRAGGTKLPYDAEVAYLANTGTQWIDTGYAVSTQNVRILARYYFTSVGNTSTVWGANLPTDRNWLANQYANKWWFGTTSGQFGGSQPSVITDVEWNINDGVIVGTVGATAYSGTYSGSIVSGYSVYLFAVNNGGQAIRANGGRCRLFGFKLYDNGILVRDMIPVRFTNELDQSEGAMYDRVSGELEPFGNQGTGAFLWGPDASAQNGWGGYNLICVWRAYTRSLGPSSRFWRAAA